MSTTTISSALRKKSRGRVTSTERSRRRLTVGASSRTCSALSVVTTLIPDSSKRPTSSQREIPPEPDGLSRASSSTKTMGGCSRRIASTSISRKVSPPTTTLRGGTERNSDASSRISSRPLSSSHPMTGRIPLLFRAARSRRALRDFPTPGAHPRYTLSLPDPIARSVCSTDRVERSSSPEGIIRRSAFGEGRHFCHSINNDDAFP